LGQLLGQVWLVVQVLVCGQGLLLLAIVGQAGLLCWVALVLGLLLGRIQLLGMVGHLPQQVWCSKVVALL
jgi:hypothetical protein